MVSNVWIATLGGLLAQVVIAQASETPRIASPGTWNDSVLPRKFYLHANHWDINDAEILGALDGLILAEKVHEWLETNPAMRLSQLVDMYYSCRGIAYDRSMRACERGRHFIELLHRYDFVDQTITAVKLLSSFGTFDKTIRPEMIAPLARAAVGELLVAAESIFATLPRNCVENERMQGRWETILIADPTHSPYGIQQLLSALMDAVDVSPYSSNLALLSGDRGGWLLHPTHDILTIFRNISSVSMTDWGMGLSLPVCLHAIIDHYQAQESVCKAERPKGRVIIILGQTVTLNEVDLVPTLLSIASLQRIAPQTRIAYVTRAGDSLVFQQLVRQWPTNSVMLQVDGLSATVGAISDMVRHIPANLININCADSEANFDDYLTPHASATYEINLLADEKSVRFRTPQHGTLTVCLSNETCKHLTVSDEVTFRIRAAVTLFDVAAKSTGVQCTAFACRYPDQVLVEMQTTWRSRAPTHNAPSPSCRCVILIASLSAFCWRPWGFVDLLMFA